MRECVCVCVCVFVYTVRIADLERQVNAALSRSAALDKELVMTRAEHAIAERRLAAVQVRGHTRTYTHMQRNRGARRTQKHTTYRPKERFWCGLSEA